MLHEKSEKGAVDYKSELDPEGNVSFKDLFEKYRIEEIKDQLRDIAEIAGKEQGFEKILAKMKGEWKSIKFELLEFRDTETYILKALEPILDKLDEDISKVMSIAISPYIKFLEADVTTWKNTLLKTYDIIEIWTKVQRQWQYLQPIFFSDDIIRQMPREGTKYRDVDKMWRLIMNQTHAAPFVLDCCSQNKLKENF